MGFTAIKRAQLISAELDAMAQNGGRAASTASAELDRAMLFTAWLYQSLLNNSEDVDASDVPPIRTLFAQIKSGIDEIAQKMTDVQAIYDADPQIMQANLDAFVAANGLADALANYGERFN